MPQREPPGKPALEAVWRKAFEDRLGAALIKPGGFRYQSMKVAVSVPGTALGDVNFTKSIWQSGLRR